MNNLVFLDTETTGLEPENHEVWEVAYAINHGDIHTVQVPHSLVRADAKALELNGYYNRCEDYLYSATSIRATDITLRERLKGETLVAANPTFDRMMLRARWGMEPWHHRSIDIETMAMVVFGTSRPMSTKDLSDNLRHLGYDIPVPDHSAAGDVAALRSAYYALRKIQAQMTDNFNRYPLNGGIA